MDEMDEYKDDHDQGYEKGYEDAMLSEDVNDLHYYQWEYDARNDQSSEQYNYEFNSGYDDGWEAAENEKKVQLEGKL